MVVARGRCVAEMQAHAFGGGRKNGGRGIQAPVLSVREMMRRLTVVAHACSGLGLADGAGIWVCQGGGGGRVGGCGGYQSPGRGSRRGRGVLVRSSCPSWLSVSLWAGGQDVGVRVQKRGQGEGRTRAGRAGAGGPACAPLCMVHVQVEGGGRPSVTMGSVGGVCGGGGAVWSAVRGLVPRVGGAPWRRPGRRPATTRVLPHHRRALQSGREPGA